MPAAFAFARAGPTTVVSCASRTRTLAPCEISVSTSVSCCSVLRFASLSMYLPPASSTTFWMFGLSVAAQRGCWKLFQDTPTVQPAPLVATHRRRRRRRRWAGAAASRPPTTMAAVAARARQSSNSCAFSSSFDDGVVRQSRSSGRRLHRLGIPLSWCAAGRRDRRCDGRGGRVIGACQVDTAPARQPGRRIGEDRLERQLGRAHAAARRRRARPGRCGPARRGAAQRVAVDSASRRAADER